MQHGGAEGWYIRNMRLMRYVHLVKGVLLSMYTQMEASLELPRGWLEASAHCKAYWRGRLLLIVRPVASLRLLAFIRVYPCSTVLQGLAQQMQPQSQSH